MTLGWSTGYLCAFIFITIFLVLGECQLFDYGSEAGDVSIRSLRSTNPQNITLSHPIQYLGKNYSTVYVSGYGVVGFNREISFLEQEWRENPEEGNYPFIAPYYFNVYEDVSSASGHLFYRIKQGEDSILQELGEYIKSAVVGMAAADFKPDIAVIVTWHNVTDPSSANVQVEGEEHVNIQTNTFQLVIVACNRHTFAIFNYERMDVPNRQFYQAGMNGGLNFGWTDVYKSSQNDNKLSDVQASDVRGRFIYKVSDEVILRGGCIPTASTTGNLEVKPQFVNSFGGEVVDISGICINNETKVLCKFGAVDAVEAVYVSAMLVKCLVPRLLSRGLTRLRVIVDDETTLDTDLNVVLPGRSTSLTHLKLFDGWNETDAETLKLSWDSDILSKDPSATVDIRLIGYREEGNQMTYKTLKILKEKEMNSKGTFMFDTRDHRCSGRDCDLFEIGMVEVRLTHQYWTSKTTYGYLTSYPQPLGWYVVDHMTSTYGPSWSATLCKKWYENDKKEMSWQNELLDCPCNLQQALTDFGRWQTDMGCNLFTGSKCTYHIGAIHCVRSFKPTASGSGNQCCYGPDGNVRYAADSYQGSTPDRGHDWGAPPFNKPGYVPSLSHWKHDVVTFYYCCLWVKYEQCDYYMDQRATRDCKNYQPPRTAIVFGDPHIITFGGYSYDAAGRGDFWLTKADTFKLQGRFDKLPKTLVPAMALVGISLEGENSSKVEIQFSSPHSSRDDVLRILVDDIPVLFDTVERNWQDLKGLSIINSDVHSGLSNNFTIIMTSGVGIQVAAVNSLLHVTVVMPQSFENKTSGLLGSWYGTGKQTILKNSINREISVNTSTSTERIYTDFVQTWAVTDNERLFQYKLTDLAFEPYFSVAPLPENLQERTIDEVCGTMNRNSFCHNDYRATNSSDVAISTLHAELWFRAVQSFQVPVESCGLLDVPRSEKNNYNYSLGSEITITGCRKGTLSGEKTYTCQKVAGVNNWVPDVTAKCKESNDEKTTNKGINKASSLAKASNLLNEALMLLVFYEVFY